MKMVDSFEKIPVEIFGNAKEGSAFVAREIAQLIRSRQEKNQPCVLGLSTGSTPLKLYAELIRMHREEGLSFRSVITFNLDEYYPISRNAPQSYYQFMRRNLFDHIDIDPANCHVPNGELPRDQMKKHCAEYEQAIEKAGGIDLQILGIGTNGHIGFNEPGSNLFSKTRIAPLENSTRLSNAGDFPIITQMPRLSVTMGISTILKSRRIILMAWGASKAAVLKKSVEEPATEEVPASLLQQHDDTLFVVDQAAAAQLTRFTAPWLIGECAWTKEYIRKAVVSTALRLGKPILSLTNKDYNEQGLSELLAEKGNAYEINLEVFYMLRDSITGWPGGKNEHLPNPPERMSPYPKRCLIFSPHPDDDIISMGGTFMRLHDQGHDVHVGYQTSGNIAVTDEFVTRFIDFAVGFESLTGTDSTKSAAMLKEARSYLKSKKSAEVDSPEIRAVKGLIRRTEATATCRYVGIKDENIHFLNLPFYETGTIEKKPMGEEDVRITMDLLRRIKPHQVYCAGDLADPHGTHKTCLEIVFESLKRLKAAGEPWIQDCWVWLYKGAWQEWDVSEIEMAIPMSPDQVLKKRFGIFIHQSQKDMVPFQGADSREFWQRAEDRNANTANLYAELGLTKYAAMEAFVRWHY
ncbi:MAG TPA: glucosamine-6-phosphate deaminase [Puia sp.]|nr:glucosamine-6-phosphate deaminase [Puia sp.]